MSRFLPYGGFEWLSEEEIGDFDFNLVSENSDVGYILEVDLEYPSKLPDFHHDYPLAPEKLRVSSDMLSKYCSEIASRYGIKVGEDNKLIPNLGNKECHVVHYKNFQLYVSMGMRVKKIHRVLKFWQSDWLKKFVDFNTEKRRDASNEFEEKFFQTYG